MKNKYLMHDKKGFVLKDLIMSFIVFSAIIGLFYLMVIDMATTYNNTDIINENFSQNYNKLNDLNNFKQQYWNASTSDTALGSIGNVFTMLSMTLSVIRISWDMFSPTGFISSIISTFTEDFGIPAAVATIIFGALIISLVVSIIFIVINATKFGSKPL